MPLIGQEIIEYAWHQRDKEKCGIEIEIKKCNCFLPILIFSLFLAGPWVLSIGRLMNAFGRDREQEWVI